MICNKCGYEVPEFASFCTNCGNKIDRFTSTAPATDNISAADPTPNSSEETAFYETPSYESTPSPQPESYAIPKETILKVASADKKDGFGAYIKRNLALFIIAAVLLASTIVLGICTLTQSNKIKKLENSNTYLSEEVDHLNENIDSLEEDNADLISYYETELQNNESTLLQELKQLQQDYEDALAAGMLYEDLYYEIVDGVNTSNIGMASETFYLSTGIIVLDAGETTDIELYTLNDENGTIDMAYDGASAALSFTENNWDTDTTLQITARTQGVTIFSISNSAELSPVKLVVIVI